MLTFVVLWGVMSRSGRDRQQGVCSTAVGRTRVDSDPPGWDGERTLEEYIRKGLGELGLADETRLRQLVAYVKELEKWNRRVNLVGFTRGEEIVRGLLYDAFFLHTHLTREGSVLDLGSGSGALAFTLAVLDEDRRVISLDKSLKKIQFQRHVGRLLSLSNLTIMGGRAEDLEPLGAEVLVAKAFGTIRDILTRGGRHLVTGGRALLLRGKESKVLVEAGFLVQEARPYRLPDGEKEYQLFVYKKVS